MRRKKRANLKLLSDEELMDEELMDEELMDKELMDKELMDEELMDEELMDEESLESFRGYMIPVRTSYRWVEKRGFYPDKKDSNLHKLSPGRGNGHYKKRNLSSRKNLW
jgi:hypothetical protein